MHQISFWTAVEFKTPKGFIETSLGWVDSYFHLFGEKAIVPLSSTDPDLKTKKVDLQWVGQPWYLLALKIASYATLLVPLVALIAKVCLRAPYMFISDREKLSGAETAVFAVLAAALSAADAAQRQTKTTIEGNLKITTEGDYKTTIERNEETLEEFYKTRDIDTNPQQPIGKGDLIASQLGYKPEDLDSKEPAKIHYDNKRPDSLPANKEPTLADIINALQQTLNRRLLEVQLDPQKSLAECRLIRLYLDNFGPSDAEVAAELCARYPSASASSTLVDDILKRMVEYGLIYSFERLSSRYITIQA